MRSSILRPSFVVLAALLAGAAETPAVELYLKASGGFVRSRFGDIDQARKDWSAGWQAFVGDSPGWGFEQTGRLRQSSCTSFGGELLAKFGGRWGVGLGWGLLYSNFVDHDGPLYVQKPAATIEYMFPTKIAAYPVYLFGEYSIIFGKAWETYLRAGMGLVPAKYVHREKFRDLKDELPGVSLTELASAGGSLLLAGAGVRFPADAALSLFAEAGYVLALVGSFEGNLGGETRGRLYFFQEYDSALDFWQTKIRLLAEEPAGLAYRAVRKASIDFRGFSLRAGLMMAF